MDKSVTVIMPAYNEEGNIEDALRAVTGTLEEVLSDYEIIVIDDGGSDRTAFLALRLANENSRIKVFSNGENKGYGTTFKRGLGLAHNAYVTVFPGDNDMSAEVLKDLIRESGQADLILTHMASDRNRSWLRRILSKSFVAAMNGIFSLRLKYYNGAFICRVETLRGIPIKSQGLTVLAECVVRLIKAGCSYKSIPFKHLGRKANDSKALTPKSITAVAKTIFLLMGDIYFLSRKKRKDRCST